MLTRHLVPRHLTELSRNLDKYVIEIINRGIKRHRQQRPLNPGLDTHVHFPQGYPGKDRSGSRDEPYGIWLHCVQRGHVSVHDSYGTPQYNNQLLLLKSVLVLALHIDAGHQRSLIAENRLHRHSSNYLICSESYR